MQIWLTYISPAVVESRKNTAMRGIGNFGDKT